MRRTTKQLPQHAVACSACAGAGEGGAFAPPIRMWAVRECDEEHLARRTFEQPVGDSASSLVADRLIDIIR